MSARSTPLGLTTNRRSWESTMMGNVARLLAVATMVACVLPVPVASGRAGPRLYRLRIDGYVGPPPEGRREMADLSMRAGKKDVRFQVTAATVLSGSMHAANVFNRVRPYRPNFILRGSQALLGQVGDAADGSRLRIPGAGLSGPWVLEPSS